MEDEIFRVSKDKRRAKDLLEMAKDRLQDIKKETKTYKIIEQYYEIVKELLTSIMYAEGYKTLSHIKLIEYFSSNYKELNETQIKLIDTLRKFRNSIVYYGEKISQEFLTNNEEDIKKVIGILIQINKEKLNI